MKIDLNKLLSIHIGGEIAKQHSLPIEYFIGISKNLQELIFALAKHNLSEDIAIDLSNFKIEICGFKEGSAVPQFRFTENMHYLNGVDVIQQRKKVNESFEKVLEISDSGDYKQLKKIYTAPEVRNDVVEKIYQYTNSFGSAPVEVVNVSKTGKIIKLYKNNKLKPEAKKSLQVDIVAAEPDEVLHETAVGKIAITRSKKGVRNKISEVYREKDASLSYKTDKIVFGKRTYKLHAPIMSNIEREDNYFIITSDMLGITGTGETESDAKNSFAEEFDFIYKRYNELKDADCSDRILRIKTIINAIVAKVEGK